MLYAVKDGPRGPQLRAISYAAEAGNDEVLYDGPITMKSDGLTIDMTFDKRCGLRPKNDDELLADAKEDALTRIKLACEECLDAGCQVSLGWKMDCDDRSVSLLSSTGTMLQQIKPEKVTVCDYDNQTHEVPLDEFQAMALEIGAYVQSAYQKKWTLRQKISEAASTAELTSITWS